MILVTGGAGYIGAHAVLALLEVGEEVLVLDNFCNSSPHALTRIEQICGRRPVLIRGDVRNREVLARLFSRYPIRAVLHFAGLKAVGESVRKPLHYYDTNVSGTINLCQAMASAGVFTLVFSSSATVYGNCRKMPIAEQARSGRPTNPYGQSKLMAEQVLGSLARADQRWRIALLRYFNPVGAHPSGLIGESPNALPNNLLPYLLRVADGQLPVLPVYGSDYPTVDGSGVRDYIHVQDLVAGHIDALHYLRTNSGIRAWNLGTGIDHSVLQVVKTFERVTGMKVPVQMRERRPGDVAQCWADPSRARRELGWVARYGLETMLRDAWHWQCTSPEGYEDGLLSVPEPLSAGGVDATGNGLHAVYLSRKRP
ncbi:UDP-glucose 4-epimerase GalE [Pseudomonas cichorii]|nr:UDP-glucose 4-epimerase GalE [Pseudomonas cichorii]